MMILLGMMTAGGGLFLFLWYGTIVGLPLRQRPRFIYPALFKWGVPAISLLLFVSGSFLLFSVSFAAAAGAIAASAILMFLVARFDRYSANMRMIRDHYLEIRRANPDLEEAEVLFHTARWRYPKWSHDRLVELTAGKEIRSLILLMIINEFEINPIQDWELYRTLKAKLAHIVPAEH